MNQDEVKREGEKIENIKKNPPLKGDDP